MTKKITHPLKAKERGVAVIALHDALVWLLDQDLLFTDGQEENRKAAEALRPEIARQSYDRITKGLVDRAQRVLRVPTTGEVDEATATALNRLLDEMGYFRPAVSYEVEGRVASRSSAAVSGLRVVIVDKGVGGDATLVQTETDGGGRYQVCFSDAVVRNRGKDKPDLQARVFIGDRLLVASEVRYDATPRVILNVLLDEKSAAALRSEYETLTAAVATHYKGRLGELKETDERQDISYLANKSGWDARAVALAALADQFGARTAGAAARAGARIEPALFYALFRAGVPAVETALYRTDPALVEGIWKQAIERGVIPAALAERVPTALEQFQKVAAAQLLDGAALVGVSPLKDLLRISLGDDAEKQERFATLYTAHADDRNAFWTAVQDAFGDATANRLKLDGQLAYLTLNNGPLVKKLHAAVGAGGLADTGELVEAGFYSAERWRQVVAGSPVPAEIPGKDAAEKADRYAELMAAQIRLSFPTAVVAHMVKAGATALASADVRDDVHSFLAEHSGRFEIGMQPIVRYVARNQVQVDPAVIREITRIQRVYQITPNDRAMNGMLAARLDSARAVVAYEADEFVRAFADAVGGEQTASMIHAKARQVHTAVLNIAVTYLTAKNAPGIGVHSPPAIVDSVPTPPANVADVLAYATLEDLFGEMDYCACSHCRSVLSPAAYLVDLLQFLDRPATEVPPGFTNPLTVLLDRRPDIQHLPLTCENTNTPLPYIDLVNETLEYYVTNGLSLADFAGHSIDDSVRPEELLASPQFVTEAAYTALAAADFPPPLPFHQPLETLRRQFARFDAPLMEVMEALRVSDDLERAGPDTYGQRDIWMEMLGLSRAEYSLLTERQLTGGATDLMLSVKQLYGFTAATADADVRAVLDNARSFCRRVDVTYEQLVDILKTRFVNRGSELLPRLARLGVPFSSLKALKDGAISDAAFDALLAPGLDPAKYGGDIRAWVKDDDNYNRVMSLIILVNPADEEDMCSFDAVELRYSNPDNATNQLRAFEFVRLIRFIRLWKKLGWTIEQTDKALAASFPAAPALDDPSDDTNLERLDAGFLAALPAIGVIRRVMALLKLTAGKDLLPLLSCFAAIDTHGESSLYRQMFLGPSRTVDAFADDGYGSYLDGTGKLLDHAGTLRAAFALTASEFAQITEALGYDATTALTVAEISAVFRRGWLARRLKLSVRELLLLIELTGLDPFGAPDPEDPGILRLLELIGRVRGLGVKPVQLLYLMWNQDLSGKSAPAELEVATFVRNLRLALTAIVGEFALVDDPDGSIARARMTLVYGTEATDLFFGLLDDTFVSEVEYSHGQPALEPAILAAAPGRVGYDDYRKRLAYSGVLDTVTRDALKAVAGVSGAFQTAVDDLYDENQSVVGPFFARYPELLPLHDAYVASADPPEERRNALLAAFLPELVRRRRRQQALQSVTAAAGVELGLASALLENPAVLRAAGNLAAPGLDDLTAVDGGGLAASFFFAAVAVGNPDLERAAEPVLAYAPGSNPLPPNAMTPGDPISAIWRGHLEAPENGFYNLRIDTDAAASVTLTLDGEPVTLAQNGGRWTNASPVELRAGALVTVSLVVERVTHELAVLWQTAGRGWEVIPPHYLYSSTLTDNLRLAYVRFLKAAALAAALRLSQAEIAHLAAAYPIAGEGWLNRVPVTGDPDGATAIALLEPLGVLLDYTRIKAAISPGDERLLDVLRGPAVATAEAGSLLFVLTRWDQASVDALLARFGLSRDDLAEVPSLRRVHDAYEFVGKLGISAEVLIDSTTNEPTAATVRNLQGALRARYDETAWLDVLKPINDELRALQRDALVAFVLHQFRSSPASAHVDTPDKLFEYFLMDVQMSTCMLTSRIRNALSSIQLFTERCLMNLEPRVSAASIKARHWAWMKRYRVWEANRKVFLYPENWLEPELRDDQSAFFRETMSDLLQGDITEDRAAEALLGYLNKLEEVAKLEICGVHYEENEAGLADDVAHVIARTAGAKRKYFYRRREYPFWTPWEKITLDIEDNPVLPVVWKDRLFLFWLKLVQETLPAERSTPSASTLASVSPSEAIPTEPPLLVVRAILNWSEYFNGQWQPARTSDPARQLGLGTYDLSGTNAFDRSRLKLAAMYWTGGELRIIVTTQLGSGSSFFLYNPFSTPELRSQKKDPHFSPKRTLDTATSALNISYNGSSTSHALLTNGIEDRAIEPRHPIGGEPWYPPFFYEDNRHTFLVTTSERVVTVPRWNDYGIVTSIPDKIFEIPRLVFKPDKLPGVPIPITKQPGFGVVDPSPIDYYITEDAYLKNAIGTRGTVRYGDKELGPSGSEFGTRVR